MSARAPRRSYATPFVVTLAACSGGHQPAGNPPRPEIETHNPPDPGPTPPPTAETPPPTTAPQTPPAEPVDQKGTAVAYDQRWTVMKFKGQADCQAMPEASCPKVAPGKPVPTCNPPPPIKYACPDGFKDGDTLKIVLRANETACFVDFAPMKCPPKAACNPPRPRAVACPTR